jgi:hypothetical protein
MTSSARPAEGFGTVRHTRHARHSHDHKSRSYDAYDAHDALFAYLPGDTRDGQKPTGVPSQMEGAGGREDADGRDETEAELLIKAFGHGRRVEDRRGIAHLARRTQRPERKVAGEP